MCTVVIGLRSTVGGGAIGHLFGTSHREEEGGPKTHGHSWTISSQIYCSQGHIYFSPSSFNSLLSPPVFARFSHDISLFPLSSPTLIYPIVYREKGREK